MSLIIILLLAALSVMFASLIGVVFINQTLGTWMRSRLTYLATFSAGVLGVLAYHLIEEAFHEVDTVGLAAASIVAGVVLLEVIHHLLPAQHHHHEITADHAHTAVDGRRVLVSDAVHNVTDGFLIVPAFLIDWKVGVAATLGIFLHELVQEISEFFVLKEAGYSDRKALTLNFAVSSTILIGIGLALTFASFEAVLVILTGFAAGGFLSVVIRDLIPHAFASAKAHGKWISHGVAGLVGIVVMVGVITLVPHEEYHDEPEHIESMAVAKSLE
ncbi:hypothetical protein C4585_00680 [Candidatus Parcubacteria bacterium]|nr:MAG: hypothetical protein C4585_00680 [Candidatus Parcubacteria bacterium]